MYIKNMMQKYDKARNEIYEQKLQTVKLSENSLLCTFFYHVFQFIAFFTNVYLLSIFSKIRKKKLIKVSLNLKFWKDLPETYYRCPINWNSFWIIHFKRISQSCGFVMILKMSSFELLIWTSKILKLLSYDR